MLARDGKVIADDGSKMTFTTHGAEINEKTGKPEPDAVSFDYEDGDTRYELMMTRQKTRWPTPGSTSPRAGRRN